MKRRVIIIVLASLGISVAIAAIWNAMGQPADPVYEGKSLSLWLTAAGSTNNAEAQEARQAIVKIGTNAVPFLIHRMRHEALKTWWLRKADRVFHSGTKFSDKNSSRILAVHRALIWLGLNSLPDLEAAMEESSNSEILYQSYSAAEMIVVIRSDSRYSQFPLSSNAVKKVSAAMFEHTGRQEPLDSVRPSGN